MISDDTVSCPVIELHNVSLESLGWILTDWRSPGIAEDLELSVVSPGAEIVYVADHPEYTSLPMLTLNGPNWMGLKVLGEWTDLSMTLHLAFNHRGIQCSHEETLAISDGQVSV